jgi:long-chain fatty acid transport protein
VQTINVSPTIGYKVNDWLSIGAALQVQYFKASLKQANGVTAAATPIIIQGDTIDFGYRFGATLTPLDGTTIGLAYRSSVKQTLEGSLRSARRPATFRSRPT